MALLVVSSLCLVLNTVVIALRFFASKRAKRGFGLADWIILGGYVSTVPSYAFSCLFRLTSVQFDFNFADMPLMISGLRCRSLLFVHRL